MPSNDLITNYAPPPGGLAKLMRRIDQVESSGRAGPRRQALYGGLLAGGLVAAAALAVMLLPHSSPTLSELVERSDALHLYKYGLREMPAEGVRMLSPSGVVTLRPTGYGYKTEGKGD